MIEIPNVWSTMAASRVSGSLAHCGGRPSSCAQNGTEKYVGDGLVVRERVGVVVGVVVRGPLFILRCPDPCQVLAECCWFKLISICDFFKVSFGPLMLRLSIVEVEIGHVEVRIGFELNFDVSGVVVLPVV